MKIAPPPSVAEVTWFGDAKEVRHALSPTRPLWVRSNHVTFEGDQPRPSVPQAEWHPYCELHFNFEGTGIQSIGGEKMERTAGDLMLLGSGTPHYATYLSSPQRSATVYFLPTLLLEMGPEGDGARMLARFTQPRKIEERIIRLPQALGLRISQRFEAMVDEFTSWKPGSEFRLRSLLADSLVDFIRWEKSTGYETISTAKSLNWLQVEKTLRFLHAHYAEPLYIAQIARVSGLSVARLQLLFHEALAMSCIQYLRGYRIAHAAALLCAPEARVTDVAFAVGFETLSHFNTSFRSLMGTSPSEYTRKCRAKIVANCA